MFFRGKHSAAPQRDWVDEATDTIERVVDGLRDKAVVPLTTVARAVVYGLLAALVGIPALVVLCILGVRLFDIYLDYIPGVPENVWFAYLILGAIFVGAGLLARRKRYAKN